jgi:hypothetical protein
LFKSVISILGLLCLALSVGCGDGRLDVAPVRGRVTYGGQGVPQAVVIFHPGADASEQLGKMRPFAYADNDGNFEIKTYVDGDGAPPGAYRVSIIARSSQPRGGPSKDNRIPEALSGPGINIPAQVSKKYADVDTSGIKVTIVDGENNLEPFVL